uniref:Longin domain-containing protein n=1 Tax=Oryza meridionalis TaxID=40149 RepID=A0A0E0DPH9_9ORYZ
MARGTVILAEYTEFTGNFTTIASQCLMKLPASNNKFTYNCDGHKFNYLMEDGFKNMQYCGDHPEEISKLAKVKAQVSEVKGVMMENIE